MGAARSVGGRADPSIVRRTLHLIFDATPGRLRNTLILVAGVCATVVIWEVFRIPDAVTACYVILFISRGERTSTIESAMGFMVLGPIAVILAVLTTMVGLSEPALRIGLMALLTFVAMFLSRAARTGTPFFAVGFIVVYGLTTSDSLMQLGLQPITSTNTNGTALPELLFIPPEESLLRTLLWLSLAFVIPGAIVVALTKAFGRDPAVMLREGVAGRLDAGAALLRREPGAAARLEALARRGSVELTGLAELAEKDHGSQAEPLDANKAAIRASSRLMLACLAHGQVQADMPDPGWMESAAARCAALRTGGDPPRGPVTENPIGAEIGHALDEIAEVSRRKAAALAGKKAAPKPGFWSVTARDPANAQFAIKVTLAVMICYTLDNALDWPGIGTSVVTCFFVALGSLGESGHKMILRITGCLIGSGLGVISVILLMPIMTDIGHLALLMAAATFVAAWIAVGSQRISYAGWQISFAFYTVVLQGFGPVTDMESAKNRIIGILLGIGVSYFIHATLWPVRVGRLIAASLANAFQALSALARDAENPDGTREEFSAAIAKAQTLLLDELYEGDHADRVQLDERFVSRVQALVLPVSMLASGQHQPYAGTLGVWFEGLSAWIRQGGLKKDCPAPPAAPDAAGDARGVYALLDRDLTALALPPPAPGRSRQA